MKTDKLIIDPARPCQDRNNKKSYIPTTFYIHTGKTGGNIRPENKASTRLQELSLMKNTYFDMNLDYTISRIFQERSLSELETLDHCELDRTQILQQEKSKQKWKRGGCAGDLPCVKIENRITGPLVYVVS